MSQAGSGQPRHRPPTELIDTESRSGRSSRSTLLSDEVVASFGDGPVLELSSSVTVARRCIYGVDLNPLATGFVGAHCGLPQRLVPGLPLTGLTACWRRSGSPPRRVGFGPSGPWRRSYLGWERRGEKERDAGSDASLAASRIPRAMTYIRTTPAPMARMKLPSQGQSTSSTESPNLRTRLHRDGRLPAMRPRRCTPSRVA